VAVKGVSPRGARERFDVLRRVMRGELRQARAAELLGIGVRQVKRLVRSYRCEGEASVVQRGAAGLVSRRRGRASNRRLDSGVATWVKGFLLGKYKDFGPALAAEKPVELEGIAVSRETVRRLQIELGVWKPKRRRH